MCDRADDCKPVKATAQSVSATVWSQQQLQPTKVQVTFSNPDEWLGFAVRASVERKSYLVTGKGWLALSLVFVVQNDDGMRDFWWWLQAPGILVVLTRVAQLVRPHTVALTDRTSRGSRFNNQLRGCERSGLTKPAKASQSNGSAGTQHNLSQARFSGTQIDAIHC